MPDLIDYLTFEEPYTPNMHHTPAVYRVDIGPFFYFGSARRVGGRVSDHTLKLERGIHPNHRMQDAWNIYGRIAFTIVEALEKKPEESKADLTARLQLREGWLLRDWFGDPRCLNLSGDPNYNTGASETMKGKWADPGWRERQMEIMRPAWARPVSEETRKKMAEAKTGSRNPKSRACTFLFQGEVLRFESVRRASIRFGVAQQAVDHWLSGKTPFPGNPGAVRSRNPQLAGLLGAYDKPRSNERWLRIQLENGMRAAGL